MFHLENIKCTADEQEILSLSELKIDCDSPTLILGPSGCGKTSLLQVMAGIRKAQSGSISYNGTDLSALKASQRDKFRGQNFGFIFQNFHLIKHLSVVDNIKLACLGAQISANDEMIFELLERLNLTDKSKSKAGVLSQGEAQRVAIARSIANKPKVIFADEPTSALDDDNTLNVMDLLKAQVSLTGAALIVATHDSRIKNHFKNLIKMNEGGLIL